MTVLPCTEPFIDIIRRNLVNVDIHEARTKSLTCVCPFHGENFNGFSSAVIAARFDAAFQAYTEILHVVEVRWVGQEPAQMLSIVVEPGPRAIRIAIGGMVIEVKTVVIRPQAQSAGLCELLHSVTVQTSFRMITQDPRPLLSSTGNQGQKPIFRAIIQPWTKVKLF
jgi:hypothetical protein